MSKRSKRKNRSGVDLGGFANTLSAFGIDVPGETEASGLRESGPPKAQSIREHGDPELSSVLAQALAESGPLDHATHMFHPYPARMHPRSAKRLLEVTSGPVHDPFCGGGTVLIEARLAGRTASGSDLSPIARLVTLARTSPAELATPLRSAARKIAAKAQLRIDVEVPELMSIWYEPHVAQELGRIRDEIVEADERIQTLLWAVFSSIVVKSSYRKSDTVNVREPHHRPTGTTATLFHKRARELGRMLEASDKLMQDNGITEDPAISFHFGDARLLPPPQEVGLLMTSPPYPGVYDYIPMHQLRYAWMHITPDESLMREVGSRRAFRAKGRSDALTQWQLDTAQWVNTQAGGLREGGAMVIIVGDGLVGGKLVDALYPTVEAMKSAGLEIVARASADRPDHARKAVRIEHMVMAVKTSTETEI